MKFFDFVYTQIHPLDYIYIPILFVFAVILIVVSRKNFKTCQEEKNKQL